MFVQVCDRVTVNLHHGEISLLLQQELREHTGAGPHFQYRECGKIVEGCRNTLCDLSIFQKMLPQAFLCSYLKHYNMPINTSLYRRKYNILLYIIGQTLSKKQIDLLIVASECTFSQ